MQNKSDARAQILRPVSADPDSAKPLPPALRFQKARKARLEPELAGKPAKSAPQGEKRKAPEPPRPPSRPASKPEVRWDAGSPVLVKHGDDWKHGTIAHFNHGNNGGPRRARVSLADGGKLDNVREEQLLRVRPL